MVKPKEALRSDGEHYTSETNILKTLEPLFLNELRAEAKRLIETKTGSVKKQLENLRAFRDSLATHVFMDPDGLLIARFEQNGRKKGTKTARKERENAGGTADANG